MIQGQGVTVEHLDRGSARSRVSNDLNPAHHADDHADEGHNDPDHGVRDHR